MNSGVCSQTNLAGLRIVRVVTLASRTGKYGGPYDTARRQARLAAKLGADTVLAAAHLADDEPGAVDDDEVKHSLAQVRRRSNRHRFASLISIAAVRMLWREVRQSDIVHISFTRELVPLIAALFSVVLGKAWIAQPHGMLTSRQSRLHTVVDTVVLPLLRRANTVIALTHVEKDEIKELAGLGNGTFLILGNPLPEDMPIRIDQDATDQVIFIARLHPRKRVQDFVEAARYAAEHDWPDHYRVIGPDEGDLPKVLAGCERLGNLEYGGSVSSRDVLENLRVSGVFVLCSDREPWGNVLVSALAMGVPVVMTRSAALSYQIEELDAGIVVPDHRADEIAKAVHRLLSEPDCARAISERARSFAAAELSDESQMNSLARLYSRTVVGSVTNDHSA